jgi:dolichyl-phosphate beta-glucosyltransferase
MSDHPERPQLSVVVPAYNEEARLGRAARSMLRYLRGRGLTFEFIVVDDGSTDGTSTVVQRLAVEYPEVRLIRLPANRGKGHAVRTGVVNAHGDLVIFADADEATPMAELERLEAAVAAGADVAIGSRAMADRSVTIRAKLHRRLMGRIFHRLVTLLTVKGFHDTQCGFKLFRSAAAHDLFARMRMDRYSFDVELLMMAQRIGYRIAEVPVNWVHVPGSQVNLLLDSFRMARDLLVIRGNFLRGQYDAPRLTPLYQEDPGS